MSRTNIVKLIAAFVIVSAILAAPASAKYYEEPGGSQAPASQTYVPVAEPGTSGASSGFDWGDAAVGAAGALIVLTGAAVVTIRRHRDRGHTLATG